MTEHQLVEMISRMEPADDAEDSIATINRLIAEAKKAAYQPPFDHERCKELRRLAREQHCTEGECEIDDGAVISHGDEAGVYVQAWVWVDFQEGFLDDDSATEPPAECPQCKCKLTDGSGTHANGCPNEMKDWKNGWSEV